MDEPDDRLLDLALRESLGSDPGRDAAEIDAALRSIGRRRLSTPAGGRRLGGKGPAALAASLVFLALTAWLALGRVAPSRQESGLLAAHGQQVPEEEFRRLLGQLSDSDAAVRDSAFLALKGLGPDLLHRLREERTRARDAETRARLQDLVDYWTRSVAAVVGDEVISWDDVDAALPPGSKRSEVPEDLRRQTLRRMVEERVFFQEAGRRGLAVSDADIQDALRRGVFRSGLGGLPGSAVDHEGLRRQLSIAKLYERMVAEAGENGATNPFGLDLGEPTEKEIRAWYDANAKPGITVERADVCWVELPFEGERDKAAKKALAEALVIKTRALKALGRACAELGVKERVWVGALTPEHRLLGPFREATRRSFFDGSFGVGEVRIVQDGPASVVVAQVYDRRERASGTFEETEPQIRSLLESRRRESNRKRLRDGLLRHARIYPPDLFNDP